MGKNEEPGLACMGYTLAGKGTMNKMRGKGVILRNQRVSCIRFEPVRKGSGEEGEKKTTKVGVKVAVPLVPN